MPPGEVFEGFGPGKSDAFGNTVELRRLRGEFQRRGGAINRSDVRRPVDGGLHGKAPGVAIDVADAPASGKGGGETSIVPLVEEPAGLLAAQRVGQEAGVVFLHRDRAVQPANRYLHARFQALERARGGIVAQYDGARARRRFPRREGCVGAAYP